jgi:hypothetical protein
MTLIDNKKIAERKRHTARVLQPVLQNVPILFAGLSRRHDASTPRRAISRDGMTVGIGA